MDGQRQLLAATRSSPGLTDDSKVDCTPLDPDNDLFDVKRELMPASANWKGIGLALRLNHNTLDGIQARNNNDPTACVTSVVTEWLKRNYKVEKFGEPNWRWLVEAVGDPAGGANNALARDIARKHKTGGLPPPRTAISENPSPPPPAVVQSVTSSPPHLSPQPYSEEREPLSRSHIISCSRGIDADADLSLLAAALDIHDEEVASIKSKFKSANGQALKMLKEWQSSGTHTRQELMEILQSAGYLQAAQILHSVEGTSTTKRELNLRELVTHVRTTEWYRLGLLLHLDGYKLQQIRDDARGNQEHLTLVLETWLKTCENPAWVDVVRALKAIGENSLGVKLEQKFCK